MKVNKKRVVAWLALMSLSAGIGYEVGLANAETEVQVVKVVEYLVPSSNDSLENASGDPEAASDRTEGLENSLSTSKTSLGNFKITAYCPCSQCCGKYANGITATGTIATEGRTIAADPKVLPYGTSVWIDGKEYVVEDCGGAIKGNEIDLYFDSHEEALRWGVQTKEVYVK